MDGRLAVLAQGKDVKLITTPSDIDLTTAVFRRDSIFIPAGLPHHVPVPCSNSLWRHATGGVANGLIGLTFCSSFDLPSFFCLGSIPRY